MSWHLGRMAGFDLETTGTDPEVDRIVTACVVRVGGGQPMHSAAWFADPGVEIPEAAAAVHGVTTERARVEGRPAGEVVSEVVAALAQAVRDGVPIMVMNAAFDLTMLDREARRHGLEPLTAVAPPFVVDPYVLDRQVDVFRRGGRTLTDLCRHYQVTLDGAHSADADAVAACRVAWRIATRYARIGAMPLGDLHALQVAWARQQAESLRMYFARTPGKESRADGVRGDWPLIPAPRGGDAA